MGDQPVLNHRLALIGNPNCGKSSLFNQLTGLRQRTGNFPGVTVEQHSGAVRLPGGDTVKIIDFPGTYSLYPTSLDERVVFDVLSNPAHPDFPDLIIYVADALRLDQHLLLLAQVRDLGIPAILALNLVDAAADSGISYALEALSEQLDIPVVAVNGRTGEGIPELKEIIHRFYQSPGISGRQPAGFLPSGEIQAAIDAIREAFPHLRQDFQALLHAHHAAHLSFLTASEVSQIQDITTRFGFHSLQAQHAEIMARYRGLDELLDKSRRMLPGSRRNLFTRRLDRVLTHKVWGPFFFLFFLLLVFQAVFTWSSLPMEWIESLFVELGGMVRYALGEGWMASLLSDGILAGLGGVLVFIPQIALLFLLISLLEESGYMARAVYLFDRLMRRFGLNGRSLVALVSGTACAIPAIMSARTITNSRERLITILVTPFMSCSARLPVYAVLVGLMVPAESYLGLISYQALVFMGLYLLGVLAAFGSALVLKRLLKTREEGFLLIELPDYQSPHWRNVLFNVWSKVSAFVREAGKIILVISIILWFLASFGPPGRMDRAQRQAEAKALQSNLDVSQTADLVAAARMEASFAGVSGKLIEPLIRPLGFDWKIGIALITSFAAREVFVGTMATIYSIGSTEDEQTIRQRMAEELNPDTGKPRYTLAVSLSLLLFYVFAMQCMSTIAVVRKETGTWKWPLLQFAFMTGLAYVASLTAYQTLMFMGWS
jgi:ferrous iron transport protein B